MVCSPILISIHRRRRRHRQGTCSSVSHNRHNQLGSSRRHLSKYSKRTYDEYVRASSSSYASSLTSSQQNLVSSLVTTEQVGRPTMGIVSEAMWLGYAVRRGVAAAARAIGMRFRELGTLRGGSPSWRGEVAVGSVCEGWKDSKRLRKCVMLVADMMTCRWHIHVAVAAQALDR